MLGRWLSKGNQLTRSEWLAALLGILPAAIVVLYFKIGFAPPNDLIGGLSLQSFQRLIDTDAFAQIAMAYLNQAFLITPKLSTPFGLFFVFMAIWGISKLRLRTTTGLPALIAVVLLLAGYFVVYMTTPHSLTWHLRTSLSRLFMQAWPLLVFAMTMIASEPRE